MSWHLVVDPAAEAELREAAEWYNGRGPAIREAFLNAVAASLNAIEDNPLQYQCIRGEVRRAMVGRFPYALLYSIDDKAVVVTVCFHTSRHPKRWHGRFPS